MKSRPTSDRRPRFAVPWIWAGVALVLTLAAILRFWEITSNFHFMGDEGAQSTAEWRLLHGQLPLLGPGLSIGQMHPHLGPFFYYLAAIPLWITGGSPVGPTVLVGVFGVGTVLLLFVYLRFPLGDWPALGGSAAMAASFLMVEYSRRPWNPTPTPFFALLFLWSLVLWKRHSPQYAVLTAGTLAILVQLQPVNIFLVAVLVIFLILARPAVPPVSFLVGAVALFIAISSPLILYDLTHGFANTENWLNALFGGGKGSGGPHSSSPRVLFDLFNRAFEVRVLLVSLAIALVVSLSAMWVAFVDNDATGVNWEVLLALILLAIAAVGFEVYRKEVFEQYMVCLFPIPFIFLASFLRLLWRGRVAKVVAGLLVLALVVAGVRDVVQYSFLTPEVTLATAGATTHDLQQDDIYQHVTAVCQLIERWVEGKPYTLDMASSINQADGYAYVLSRAGVPPKTVPVGASGTATVLLIEPPSFPRSHWTPTQRDIALRATRAKSIGLVRVYYEPATP